LFASVGAWHASFGLLNILTEDPNFPHAGFWPM
jgi:hypothetical protein